MNWKIPDWLKAFGLDIVAGLGVVAIEEHRRKKGEKDIAEKVAAQITTPGHAVGHFLGRKMVEEAVNRPEFYHELGVINADPPGCIQAIVDLFHQIQNRNTEVMISRWRLRSQKGLVEIGGTWYRETWIIAKLQMIDPKHRTPAYQKLSRLLEEDPAKFIDDISILNEDNWLQIVKQARVVIGESRLAQVIWKLPARTITVAEEVAGPVGKLADWLESQKGGRW